MRNVSNLQSYNSKRGQKISHADIWAVGGGKGGVGKSFVSSGLALFLANQGKTTAIIDLDIGAANLHSYLNLPVPNRSLQDVILDRSYDLESVMIDTHHSNLKLISGHNEKLNLLDLTSDEKSLLMSSFYRLGVDNVILDLSAGTHETTLDFFNAAQKQIVVVTPEPTSIENAYRFMREAFYKKLKRLEKQFNLSRVIQEIMENTEKYNVNSPADLLHVIHELEPEAGAELAQAFLGYEFNILINQTRSHKDRFMAKSIASVCRKYFGVEAQVAGHLDYDNAVWQSLRNRKHLLMAHPHSPLYNQLMTITRSLVDPSLYRKVAY